MAQQIPYDRSTAALHKLNKDNSNIVDLIKHCRIPAPNIPHYNLFKNATYEILIEPKAPRKPVWIKLNNSGRGNFALFCHKDGTIFAIHDATQT